MKQKKVLIIEDDLILLNLLKEKLIKTGYNVISAENGKTGLRMVASEQPDLVLLDIILPGMDGINVLQEMRKNPAISSTAVIIVSNSGQPVEIEKAKQLGIADYLIKTEFDPKEVLKKVDDFFEKTGEKNNERKEAIAEKKLAAAKPLELEAKEKSKTARSDKNQTTVLIVEDDQFLRELMARKLIKEGMDVLSAITAEEALTLLKKERPHLILLDIVLPGMNGFDFLKKIQSDTDTFDIPVIVLSNLGEENDRKTAKNLGAKSFLIKALNAPNEIMEEIKKVLRQN